VSKRDTKPKGTPTAETQPKLSLEDTIAQKMRGVPTKARTGVVGYNPYDAEPAAKGKQADGKPKPTDLRKLSEWIRLQRQVAELNPDAPKKKPP
jgi:hypothetical protein